MIRIALIRIALLLLIAIPSISYSQQYGLGGSGLVGGRPTLIDFCASHSGAAYCQDFDAGGAATNCGSEDPAMVVNGGSGNCAYTGTYLIDGIQSLDAGNNADYSAWTALSGAATQWIQLYLQVDASPTDEVTSWFFRGQTSVPADTYPSLEVRSRSTASSTFGFRIYCDGTFTGGTFDDTVTTLTEETLYTIKVDWTEDTAVANWVVCDGGVGAACDSSTNNVHSGSCDGADNPGDMTGWKSDFVANGNYYYDDILITDTDPSPGASATAYVMDFEGSGCADTGSDTCTVNGGNADCASGTGSCDIGTEGAALLSLRHSATTHNAFSDEGWGYTDNFVVMDFLFNGEVTDASAPTATGIINFASTVSATPTNECGMRARASADRYGAFTSGGDPGTWINAAENTTYNVRIVYDITDDICTVTFWTGGWGSAGVDVGSNVQDGVTSSTVNGWTSAGSSTGTGNTFIYDDIAICRFDDAGWTGEDDAGRCDTH